MRAGVGLDAQALRAAPDLAAQLRIDDLRQSGWSVTGPTREGDGLTWVRASKPFSTPAQATAVMNELGGPQSPFQNLVLHQTRTLLKSKTAFSGVVDLSGGLSGFIDPDLRAKVGDDFKLDDSAFRFEVTARLPGETKVWRPPVGQRTVLQASAQGWRLVPVLPATGALVCATLAAGLTLRRRRSSASNRRGT